MSNRALQQHPIPEADSYLAVQEITRILCNPKIHYSISKSPPTYSILIELKAVHILVFSLILSSQLRLLFASGLLLQGLTIVVSPNFSYTPCMLHVHLTSSLSV